METSEAIKTLTAAGKGKDVEDLMNRKASSADQRYRQIRDDTTRTDESKSWLMSVSYLRTRREVDEELTTMASRVARADRNDAGASSTTMSTAGPVAHWRCCGASPMSAAGSGAPRCCRSTGHLQR